MTSSSNRAYSRFIPREEIEAQAHIVTQWDFGLVGSPGGGGPAVTPVPAPTLADSVEPPEPVQVLPMIEEAQHLAMLEHTREQAYAQGHAEGLAQGQAQGQAQADQQWQQRMQEYAAGPGRETAQRLDGLAQAFDASLSALQQRMAKELLQLACDIARQVVRRELSNNPQALLPVVREALDMFVKEGRVAHVRLHPDDWKHLEQPLQHEFAQAKVQWQVDAGIAAGDCLVESAGTVVDAGLDKRWQRAVAALGLVSSWQESSHEH